MTETMNSYQGYQEFDVVPEGWTFAKWGERNPVNGDRELVNESDPLKWSGDEPPPAVGAKIEKIYLNNLGSGTVTGFFSEYGWLGLIVRPDKPPKWWRDQNPDGEVYHLFGIDLQPRKVKVT